ncbi:MAG TPA: MHYT domain-containing protein [Burkholderiales bacterium]|nr:MHYT domain-containing protein [Burkholderiales bacterium]
MNNIHYELFLVGLSFVISVFGSYTALQLAIAIPLARTWTGVIGSVLGASVALGGGAIWSMHFIGMNAADMGMPVAYDPVLTFASLAMAVVAPAIGLFIVGRSDGGPLNLPIGGVLTGLGVALMHYTGMAAMILPAKITYDPTLFYASIAIAVVAATVALWLAFNLRGNLQRFGSAIVMGIAVCGMHYTGMYAARIEPTKDVIASTGIALSPASLGYSVFGVAAVLLTLLLVYSAWKAQRRLEI